MSDERTIYRTRADLEAENAAILTRYPHLASVTVDCCSGCATDGVRREHGATAAEAYEQLRANVWLLGEGK